MYTQTGQNYRGHYSATYTQYFRALTRQSAGRQGEFQEPEALKRKRLPSLFREMRKIHFKNKPTQRRFKFPLYSKSNCSFPRF